MRTYPRLIYSAVTILLAFFHTIMLHGAAQLPEHELTWKNVTVGGKKTAVFSLFIDSRGMMWLGTNSGLYFYDGVTTHPVGGNELYGIQIYAIVERGGRLYLGSNNGLLVYDYGTGQVTPYPSATPKEIRALLLTDEALWIGSLNGMWWLDFREQTVSDRTAGLPHRSVYSILRDSRGIIYAGTYSGLARWDAGKRMFDRLDVRLGDGIPSSIFANCILESDDRRSIYIGTEGSLYRYSPSRDSWTKIGLMESNTVKSLSKGDGGHILIGTDNGVFDMSGDTVRHYHHDSRQELSIADNEIWCILSDADHNVWAGHERGFSIASNSSAIRTVTLSALSHSGEGNEIHSITRDSRGDLWFAGTNGVIRLSDSFRPVWYRHGESPHSLSHNRIRAICEDASRRMWFATDGGINRFRPETGDFEVFHVVDDKGKHDSNWVYAFIEDGDKFWTGSFLNGLHYVDKSKFDSGAPTVVSDFSLNAETRLPGGGSLANNLVNDVIKDSRGDLWILLFRDNALNRYNPSDRTLKKIDIHSLTGGYPLHLSLDRRGRIWCAFNGGAAVFDGNDTCGVVRFPHTNGDETVLAMGNVGDGMWISTQSNVWSVDGATFKATLLPIPQKNYTAIYDDTVGRKVFLGGTDEVIEVDRASITGDADYGSIRMVVTERVSGQPDISAIRIGPSGLTTPYGGSVTLVVSTLDYSPESLQRYMYKIVECPGDTADGWVVMPEGANTITLSDLKMGSYQVLVKTVGSPATPVSVPLRVDPPPALSWWAIALYLLAVAGIVTGIVIYTRRRNLEAFREQERQSALENVERKLSFLSTISHDLKTPLSMILGPVSMMKEKAKDSESRKNLETIYDNAVRLNNMIHRTLELQQLEDTDENLLILSIFDAVAFCKGVFEVFQENNPNKKFVFHSECAQLLVEADAVKFESVMTNLLSNACKYSDAGATITCGVSRRGETAEIVVSDDGVGISATDQPLVFQRMFRAQSTARLKEGTGLGLYLIKKYLEAMGGNIGLYSKEGEGTSFVVSLPVTDKAAVAESRRDPAVEDSGKAKILIVEDNLQISTFISDMLKEDYTVLTTENGRAGLAIAASFVPDLIIADEMMPIMTGLDMVRRLKQNPRLSAIPIIMLTAKTDNRTENESIKLGIEVFMVKPFEPRALLGRIDQLLRSRDEIRERVRIQAIAEAESKPIEAESVNERSLARIARIIEENISDPDLNVNLLCEKSGIPNKQLYRLIKKYMGIAPLDYIRNVRLQKAAVLLSQHRFTVAEISYMVGFKTPSYFAKCFLNRFGVKPSLYRSDDESVGDKPDN